MNDPTEGWCEHCPVVGHCRVCGQSHPPAPPDRPSIARDGTRYVESGTIQLRFLHPASSQTGASFEPR